MNYFQIIELACVHFNCISGGGRNSIPARLQRHFNLLAVIDFDSHTLTRIFSVIVDWSFNRDHINQGFFFYQLLLFKQSIK